LKQDTNPIHQNSPTQLKNHFKVCIFLFSKYQEAQKIKRVCK
jgi:hypothetical protein